MRKIPGDPLLGFNDYFDEGDIFLGAALPAGARPGALPLRPGARAAGNLPAGGAPRVAKPAGKSIPIRKAKPSKKPSPHKTALLHTIDAGKKAVAAGQQAAAAAKTYAKNVKGGAHAPLVKLKPTTVRGDGTVVLGAATRVLSPMQRAAVSKHVNAVAKNAAATRRLAAVAKKAQAVGTGALDFTKGAATAIKKAFEPKWRRPPTRVRGLEFLGLAAPDPNGPGFLMDGSLDPNMTDPGMMDPGAGADPYATMDGGEGVVTAPDGSVLYDPATDPAVIPMPVRGGTLSPEDAALTWQNVPEDGIPYDGSRGLPENCVGSWNAFYGGTKNSDGWGVPAFLRGSVDGGRTIQWLFNAPELNDQGFRVAGREFQSVATSGAPECKGVSANSLQRGWGPIVGNPRDPQLANLQYAVADGVWFWQGQNAPTWATAEADSKIALANAKVIQANRAAALVQAAQMAKDAAAMAEAQAKQDAANALARSAADTQSQIVQQQVDAQQMQLDVQTQKAELDAMTAQAMNEAAAQHALIEQTNVWNAWAKANPAEAVRQMMGPQEDDSAYESYGDEGYDGGMEGGAYDFGGGEGGGEDDGGDDAEDD